jgi:ABC-2 family transporter protein
VSSAEIVAMVVPIRIPPVYQDNFINLLQLTLTLFILLMYIPAIYRTVYRIVYEKQSRAKESMRMMGMSDFPYWLSWLAYYTIVNTVMTTLCWATLQLGVFNHKSALILYIFIWLYG